MKQPFCVLIIIFSVTSCNVGSDNNDAEIMRILKINSNFFYQRDELTKPSGVKDFEKIIKIRNTCFNNESLVTKPSDKEVLLLINYAINRELDKTDLAMLTDCISDMFNEKQLELFYPIMRRSISSNNMVSFQFFFSKYYREFRPRHREEFYLLEIAIEYCAVDFIDFLMEESFPLNDNLWGSQKKFKDYYKMVCEFDESTTYKLDEYYGAMKSRL